MAVRGDEVRELVADPGPPTASVIVAVVMTVVVVSVVVMVVAVGFVGVGLLAHGR